MVNSSVRAHRCVKTASGSEPIRAQLEWQHPALVSTETNLPSDLPAYKLVAKLVLDRIARLARRFCCDGVVLVTEESQRADRLAAAYFSGYHLQVTSTSGSRPLEMLRFRMPKAAAEPFLEVADFVAHVARHQVFRHHHGAAWGTLKDFQAVFGIADQTLVEFIETLTATWTPAVAEQIVGPGRGSSVSQLD